MKALKKIYRYYKSQRGEIPLFRVQGDYVAVFQDAEQISLALNGSLTKHDGVPLFKIPSGEIFNVLALLYEKNISAYLISCRNEQGEYDFPDIDKLEEERRIDY